MTGLSEAFAAAGAAAWGGVLIEALRPWLSPSALARACQTCPNPRTVLVAAFPYYAGRAPGNLSLYARGADYHQVVTARLNTVCNYLRGLYKKSTFFPSADNSPLPERQAAWLAGMGLRGRHGLLILPPYGSFVFLGTILPDAPLALPAAEPAPECMGCGACVAACPTGALGPGGADPARCLSELTQKKGPLTGEERGKLAAHPLIWGCDCCQLACPYNASPARSPLPEFTGNTVDSLTEADLAGLSNRTFRAKQGDRSFAWRGPARLRRNLELRGE